MAIKDLLVHLDQSERSKVRLDIAIELAQRHNARLVGLFAQKGKPESSGLVSKWPNAEYVSAENSCRVMFNEAIAGRVRAEWSDLNRGSDAAIVTGVTEFARYADLVILGQSNHRSDDYVPSELIEQVVINSGTPALVIPYVGEFTSAFKRPLIAWNNSREAVHAIRDALPLLQNSDEAVIVSLDTRIDEANSSCSAIAEHLSLHGVKSTTDTLQIVDIGTMDALLNRVSDCESDLLVMGGHGHIGFPFFTQGAGTRHILKTMTVPVVMSN
jgi:nucleotide-binding universal stress UspA family protein